MKATKQRVLIAILLAPVLLAIFETTCHGNGQHAVQASANTKFEQYSEIEAKARYHLDMANALQEYRDPKIPVRYRSDLEKSIEHCNMAIKLKPDYTDAYVERAFSYIFLNKSEESKLDFDKAIELNPYDARIYSSRGTCCGTVSDLDSAIRLDNEQPLYYEMRGNIRCESRDFFGGLIDYTQCVKLKVTSLRDCFDSFVHYVYKDERDRKLHFHLIEG